MPVGGNRPFGYKRDKLTLEPKEAALLRQAADDILAGVGLHTICRQWNQAGIRTTKDNLWRRGVLKNLLLSPRMAGFRVYQGGIARDEDGKPVTGLFPPVLPVETWQAVCAAITDPARSGPNNHTGGRKYLLSGIARCSVCGKLLRGCANRKYNTFVYNCPSPTNGGCGKVAASGLGLDKQITKLVTRYLSEREIQQEASPWPHEEELLATTERTFELMNQYTTGELSGELVFPMIKKLEDSAARLKADRTGWLRQQVAVLPTNVVDAWSSWTPTNSERLSSPFLRRWW